MRLLFWMICAVIVLVCGARAEGSGCPSGTFQVVVAPDSTSLSILFDSFVVQAGGNTGANAERKDCSLHIPLNLPAKTSLGVYRVDYRGFAEVAQKQFAMLTVAYALGSHNDRVFSRRVKNQSGDYFFTETIGQGLMKRVGCGSTAALDVKISLDLQTNGVPAQAQATLDTADASGPAIVYQFNLKPCQ